ncbi:unnamed protein product [Prorocentrum cordatum]|nr:unnamed protein product [Polarella glacialis]
MRRAALMHYKQSLTLPSRLETLSFLILDRAFTRRVAFWAVLVRTSFCQQGAHCAPRASPREAEAARDAAGLLEALYYADKLSLTDECVERWREMADLRPSR